MATKPPAKEEAAGRPDAESRDRSGTAQDSIGDTDLTPLSARQTSATGYTVLDEDPDEDDHGATAYQVDISTLECDCPDKKKRHGQGSGEICKHLEAALVTAPVVMDAEQLATRMLGDQLAEAKRLVEECRQTATSIEAEAAHVSAQAESEPESDPKQNGDVSDVGKIEQSLEAAGAPVGKLEIWKDDDYGSIQIEKDGYLEDDEFDALKQWSDQDGVSYDGDNDRNYVASGDIEEVAG